MSSPNALTLPGFGRHERARQPEDVHQPAGQQRARAAERGQREVADVEARLTVTWRRALAWFQAEISRMPVAHALQVQVELRAERRQAVGRRSTRQRDLAAEQVRGDPAEDDVRVGDGRLVAAVRRSTSGPGSAPAELRARP